MTERVLVAMSGGVDSSVAAALLCDQGFEVVGVTLHLWDYPDDGSVKGRCCAPEDVHDARRVADKLQIPHYAFDRRELFANEVVEPFVESYLAGTTPSPCVRCNRGVKIRELLHLADQLGASRVATGHYARLDEQSGRLFLRRARDESKDQSYFLHMLGEGVLRRLMFPLGELTKSEVRDRATELQLPGAQKGESQELCFVPTGRYDRFVAERARDRLRPGPIVDDSGRVVGQHEGVHQFTIGQRRNLGVALGHRTYVVGLDAETGVVRLGDRDETLTASAELDEVALRADIQLPVKCEVSVRYRARPFACEVVRLAEDVVVRFAEPLAAVVPGQFAVFYQEGRVLGGGAIRRTEPAPAGAG
jgi:tRNA-specific 2-thiouridylase